MNVRHLLVAAAAATFGLPALAQEATPDTWMHVPSAKSRAQVQQEVTVARANGDFDIAREYDVVDRQYRSVLSRSEVLADLQLWRRAGMDQFDRGEVSPNPDSAEYRRAYARYAALRASPEYAALVQSIAQRRGETLSVAAGNPQR